MRALTLVALAAVSVAAAAAGDTPPTRRESATMRQKIDTIAAHGERPGAPARRTIVTQREVNAYLVFDAKEQLPVGVVDPSVTIVGTGRLSGKATVDLDAVRKAKGPTSLLDPMNYLWGRLPVSAVGVLKTSKGVGHFELESTRINGVPIPKLLLQEIVTYYSRTPEKPAGISLDDPFELPARIRQIEVQRGQAIIVQ